MNREDIIRMAREAGCTANEANAWSGFLGRFAALIAAASASIEREACASLENEAGVYTKHDMAAAIRARGQA